MKISYRKREELYRAIYDTVLEARVQDVKERGEGTVDERQDRRYFQITNKIWQRQKQVLGIPDE